MRFYPHSPRIDFRTKVSWYESKKFLKSYFPCSLRTDFATFEVSSGLLKRPIHTNTEWDCARYEVHAHRFACLQEPKVGVAILNDCKYGYSVRDQTIGLSLLKAGEFPYEKTDKQEHEFVYSMMTFTKME